MTVFSAIMALERKSIEIGIAIKPAIEQEDSLVERKENRMARNLILKIDDYEKNISK